MNKDSTHQKEISKAKKSKICKLIFGVRNEMVE